MPSKNKQQSANSKAQPAPKSDISDKPNRFYVGGMGECYVMAELMALGFNVARAVVDEGIDIIAFKPENPQKLFRLQVKSAFPGSGGTATSRKFTFTLKQAAYQAAAGQDYYLVLVLRDTKTASFVTAIIPKAIFDDYQDNQDVIDWSAEKNSWQIAVHLHDDGRITLKSAKGTDITTQSKNRWNRIA
jgi:hypothetical protein